MRGRATVKLGRCAPCRDGPAPQAS
jgi:hypothetical protein